MSSKVWEAFASVVLCWAVSEAFAWNTLAHILMGRDAIFSLYSTRNGPLDELIHQNFRISLWACPPTPCSSALSHQSPTVKAHLNIMKPVSHCLYQRASARRIFLSLSNEQDSSGMNMHMNMDDLLGHLWKYCKCAALSSVFFIYNIFFFWLECVSIVTNHMCTWMKNLNYC